MASQLAMDVVGGGSSIPASAIVAQIDPRNVNVGIKNPAYEVGQSDQEYYNRKALPWEGAAYAVDPGTGSIVKVAGRPDAADGSTIENAYEGLAEMWTRFAAAQQNRDPNPGSLSALYADQEQVMSNVSGPGEINPKQGEGQSLVAKKARKRNTITA